MIALRVILVTLVLLVAAVPAHSQDAPSAAASAAPVPSPKIPGSPLPGVSPAAASAASPLTPLNPFAALAAAASQPQAYATFVRGTTRQAGLIDLLRKDDDIYFDMSEDQLDHTYILQPSLATGVGNGTVTGQMFDPLLIKFKRVGRRILWVVQNPYFEAPPNSPAARALAVSVADSIITSSPIVAEDKDTKRVVFAPALFLSDFENIGQELGKSDSPSLGGLFALLARPSFGLDTARSFYEQTKAFPKNDEISVNLTFTGPSTANLTSVPDPRGVPIKMHYSLVDLPSDDMTPRPADDRVGYFIAAFKRFGDDTTVSPFVRYIVRWNLARGPITYYLSDEIPVEYRPTIRRALLQWNDAFAKIGIPNAIVVKDQPQDPDWDPDDIRYSTIRWISPDRQSVVAFGQPTYNPVTGEIIRATIVIDGEFMRLVKRGYVDTVAPTRVLAPAAVAAGYLSSPASLEMGDDAPPKLCMENDCDLSEYGAALVGLSTLELSYDHRLSAAQADEYAKQWLTWLVLHESGHTLGLRHNFKGQSIYSESELEDRAFTQTHGIAGSVMGYVPTNLAEHGRPQGSYFQDRLGPYDYWAIRYGYANIPGATKPSDELPELRKVAALSTEPDLTYGTDEDGIYPFASDPRDAPYYLSNDPLAFDRRQFAIADGLIGRLDSRFAHEGASYDEERQAFVTALGGYQYAALLASRYIGGVYTSRAHRGQAGGGPPFQAIPRAEQRRAFDLVAQHILSSHAFAFSPALLNDLAPSQYSHWNSGPSLRRTDFPLTELVATLQDDVIAQMFSPINIARLNDQDLKSTHPGETMSLDDLFNWTQSAVWDDAAAPRSGRGASLHRELQRRYTDLLIAIALLPQGAIATFGIPTQTQALARYELAHLDPVIVRTLASRSLDTAERAHLEDVHSRIVHTLDPFTLRPI